MKAILVPTDFSDTSIKAVEYAAQIAGKVHVPLVLLHVCDLLDYSFQDREALVKEFNEKKKKELLNQLTELRQNIQSKYTIEISIELYDGDFMEAVLKVMDDYPISMIVIGMVGKGGIVSKLIGGKTSKLIRKCPVPVLGIPKSCPGSLPLRVVLAIEKEEKLNEYVYNALEFISMFEASVQILHFSSDKLPVYELISDTRSLHHFTSTLHEKYSSLKVDEVIIGGKNFIKAFDSYIANFPTDLLVMFAHHREWIDQITGQSITQKIIHNTSIPILIIPVVSK